MQGLFPVENKDDLPIVATADSSEWTPEELQRWKAQTQQADIQEQIQVQPEDAEWTPEELQRWEAQQSEWSDEELQRWQQKEDKLVTAEEALKMNGIEADKSSLDYTLDFVEALYGVPLDIVGRNFKETANALYTQYINTMGLPTELMKLMFMPPDIKKAQLERIKAARETGAPFGKYEPFTEAGADAIELIETAEKEVSQTMGDAAYIAAKDMGLNEDAAAKAERAGQLVPYILETVGGLSFGAWSTGLFKTKPTTSTEQVVSQTAAEAESTTARNLDEQGAAVFEEERLSVPEVKGINVRAEDLLRNTDGTKVRFTDDQGNPVDLNENQRVFRQVSDLIEKGVIRIDGLPDLAARHNLSPEQAAELYRRTISDAGRTLQSVSKINTRLRDVYKDNPEQLAKLDEAIAQHRYSTPGFLSFFRKLDDTSKVAMTSQLATTMRNLITTGNLGIMDAFERALTGLQAGTRGFFKGDKNPYQKEWDAFGAYYNGLFGSLTSKRQRQELFDVLEEANSAYNSFLYKQSQRLKDGKISPQEYSIQLDIAGDIFAPRLFGLLHSHNRLQERVFQRAFFDAELRYGLEKKGIKWEDAQKDPTLITDDILNSALDNALEKTFARTFEGKGGRDFLKAMRELGPASSVFIPFPKFQFANSLKVIGDFGPWSFYRLLSPKQRKKFMEDAAFRDKIISRSIVGTGMLMAAVEERINADADQKWYEIKIETDEGPRFLDTRPLAPFSHYLLAAQYAIDPSKISPADVSEAVLGLNRVAGTGLAIADLIRADRGERAFDVITNVIAPYLSRFTTPARTFKDLKAGVDPQEALIRSSTNSGITQKLLAAFPALSKTLPALYSPYVEGPRKKENPVMNQLTGISLQSKSRIEREALRLGVEPVELFGSNYQTGNKRKDNLIAKYHSLTFRPMFNLVMDTPGYQALSDERKLEWMREIFNDTKDEAYLYLVASDKQAEGFPEGVTERQIYDDLMREQTLSEKSVKYAIEEGNEYVARMAINTKYERLLIGTQFENLIPKESKIRRAGEVPPQSVEGFSKGGMLDQARHIFRKGYAEGGVVTDDDRDPLLISDAGIQTGDTDKAQEDLARFVGQTAAEIAPGSGQYLSAQHALEISRKATEAARAGDPLSAIVFTGNAALDTAGAFIPGLAGVTSKARGLGSQLKNLFKEKQAWPYVPKESSAGYQYKLNELLIENQDKIQSGRPETWRNQINGWVSKGKVKREEVKSSGVLDRLADLPKDERLTVEEVSALVQDQPYVERLTTAGGRYDPVKHKNLIELKKLTDENLFTDESFKRATEQAKKDPELEDSLGFNSIDVQRKLGRLNYRIDRYKQVASWYDFSKGYDLSSPVGDKTQLTNELQDQIKRESLASYILFDTYWTEADELNDAQAQLVVNIAKEYDKTGIDGYLNRLKNAMRVELPYDGPTAKYKEIADDYLNAAVNEANYKSKNLENITEQRKDYEKDVTLNRGWEGLYLSGGRDPETIVLRMGGTRDIKIAENEKDATAAANIFNMIAAANRKTPVLEVGTTPSDKSFLSIIDEGGEQFSGINKNLLNEAYERLGIPKEATEDELYTIIREVQNRTSINKGYAYKEPHFYGRYNEDLVPSSQKGENIFMHIRFDTRQIDGKKGIFINEMQAQPHQTARGRGIGYMEPEELQKNFQQDRKIVKELQKEASTINKKAFDVGVERRNAVLDNPDALDSYDAQLQDLEDKYMEIDDKLEAYRKKYGIENLGLLQVDSFESFAINPELPYKNTWTEMGTKDILKYAAENDMDFIAVPLEEKTIRKIEKWRDEEEAPKVLKAILDRNTTYIPRVYTKLVGKQHPPIKTTQIRDAEGNAHKVKVMYFPKELRKEYLDKIKSGKIGAYKDGGLIDQTRQMFNKGGEVTEEKLVIKEEDQPIVESISRRLKTDPDTLRSNLGEVKQAIKQHETGNQNIYQIVDGAARGPGAGYYQFEQKQFGGSGAAKTAVNRTLNTYKFLKQPAPQWLQNLAKDPDPDFTQLDEKQQDLIFLGNLNQERGSDKLMRALVEAKNEQEKRAAIENLWRKAHKKVKAFDKFRW